MIEPEDFEDFAFPKRKYYRDHDIEIKEVYPSFILGFRSWRIYSKDEIENSKKTPIHSAGSIFGFGYDEFLPDRDDLLYSVVREKHWTPGKNEAVCDTPGESHEAPTRLCRCGLNAFFDIDMADQYENEMIITGQRYITGAVLGWGNTEVHKDGFRSQWGQVIAFLGKGRGQEKELSLKYKAPLFERKEDLVSYGLRFGIIPGL